MSAAQALDSGQFGISARLKAERYVITGPTGWVGRAFIAWLAARIGPGWRTQVLAFGSHGRHCEIPGEGPLDVRALNTLESTEADGAIVIHLAFLGLELAAQGRPADFVEQNVAIDQTVLRALETANPRAIFVASSGMAREAASGSNYTLYGAAKLLQEGAFLDYAKRSSARVLIGRVFNVAGPFINKIENYALGSFLAQALQGREVSIRATVPVLRSYLHVYDLASMVISELLGDHPLLARPIDLCGAEATEIEDVARAALRAAGRPSSHFVRSAIDFAHPSVYLGDPTVTRSLALRHDLQLSHFSQQVEDTCDYVRKHFASLSNPAVAFEQHA